MAWDRDQWRDFVNTVMSFGDPSKREEFPDWLQTVSTTGNWLMPFLEVWYTFR